MARKYFVNKMSTMRQPILPKAKRQLLTAIILVSAVACHAQIALKDTKDTTLSTVRQTMVVDESRTTISRGALGSHVFGSGKRTENGKIQTS